jgi:hypothetical protein
MVMNLCSVDWSAILTALGVVAELLVAWVIYYEWEGGKLDRFLEDADKLADEREVIYEAYCGLTANSAKPRGIAFAALLQSGGNVKLNEACHKNIRLLSRIGARLPRTLFFKNTPLDWHVAAILWLIVGSYVEGRRDEAGPSYAERFLGYAQASTKRLLSQKRNIWTVRDPNRARSRDVVFTRDEMLDALKELRASLKRRG